MNKELARWLQIERKLNRNRGTNPRALSISHQNAQGLHDVVGKYKAEHICLIVVLVVQAVALSKGLFLEAYVLPEIYDSVASGSLSETQGWSDIGLVVFASNAIIDFLAFLVVLDQGTKTSIALAGVFAASMGLHAVGFALAGGDLSMTIYVYVARILLLIELYLVFRGYYVARRDHGSSRDFISLFARELEVKSKDTRGKV